MQREIPAMTRSGGNIGNFFCASFDLNFALAPHGQKKNTSVNRECNKNMAMMVMTTSSNKRFNEQKSSCACVLY